MRIAWFTPFTTKSAIGKYSKIATDSLSHQCDVDLWLFENEDLYETKLKKIYYKAEEDLSYKLRDYDLIFYNLGDYLYFHRDIYEVSQKHSGIVILHDFIMHHFFLGYYSMHLKNDQMYIDEMVNLYGKAGKDAAEYSLTGLRYPIWDSDDIMDFPFIEKAYENAIGVITHSNYLTNMVKLKYSGPIRTIYFPFVQNVSPPQKSDDAIKIDSTKINILTVGNINPNKRIHKIIDVIGKNRELASQVKFLILGSQSHEQYINSLKESIKNYRLDDTVEFLGYQPEGLLEKYLQKADIVCNLRFPAMEGASWSLLEQLYFGKPVMVTDNGFYSEIPDDCVYKISIENETEDIFNILKFIVDNKQEATKVAQNAYTFARRHFNPDNYCKTFVDFSEELLFNKPILKLIDTVSFELMNMKISPKSSIISSISETLENMYSK